MALSKWGVLLDQALPDGQASESGNGKMKNEK